MDAPLVYVFWHWRSAGVARDEYEARQRMFHGAMEREPPNGFSFSSSARLAGLPWAADGGEAYEDWYVVDGFEALGELNAGAVSGKRRPSHDSAAAVVDGGAGGLYGLRGGEPTRGARYAYWFSKPGGMSYEDLFEEMAPVTLDAPGALWMRQMVLGPGREFCLRTSTAVELPTPITAHHVVLHPVWPDRPRDSDVPAEPLAHGPFVTANGTVPAQRRRKR